MPEWLERELAVNLAPVEAPEALLLPLPHRRFAGRRVSAFLIAAAMVSLSAGTIWLSARQPQRATPSRWKATDHNCVLCHTL